MRDMLTGGELDYLTGDYLAELTMQNHPSFADRDKNPERGYAKTCSVLIVTKQSS